MQALVDTDPSLVRAHYDYRKPLYFAVRHVDGKLRAVLVTEELAGFRSLEAWAAEWTRRGWPTIGARRRVIGAVALAVRRMHAHRFQHNCLYAKHVFVKAEDFGEVDVRLIDLEKGKHRWWRRLAVHRDLDTLHRHSPGWRMTDRLSFLQAYLEGSDSRARRRLWQTLARLSRKKTD